MPLKLVLATAVMAALLPGEAGTAAKDRARVVVYPPVSGVARSADFSVRVRAAGGTWKSVPTYQTQVDLDTRSNASVAVLDVAGKIEVEVTAKDAQVTAARVRPSSYGVVPKVGGAKATFTLPGPTNLSFEINGDRLHNLHLFANPIERSPPKAGDPNVIYFGPGAHELPGDHILDVPSHTTVYIAGGAIVYGSLAVKNASNVVVRGHGLIDPSPYFTPDNSPGTIQIDRSSRVGIQDVTILREESSLVITDSSDVTVANFKAIGWDRWSDGIDVVSSHDVLVDGAFLRTSDDSVAVYASTPIGGHGGTRNITVRNAVLWADVAHGVLIGTHGNPDGAEAIREIDFQNIAILEHDEPNPTYQGALAVNAGDNVAAENVRFDTVRVERITRGQLVNVRVFLNSDYNKRPGRQVNRVLFRDITYDGGDDAPSQISGYSATREVDNVTFENVRNRGRLVRSAKDADIQIGAYTSAILFSAEPLVTVWDDVHDHLRYTGTWRRQSTAGSYKGHASSSSAAGSRLELTFTGKEARVLGPMSPRGGRLNVYVDGSLRGMVDTYSPVFRPGQLVVGTGLLPPGKHTVSIRATGKGSILSAGHEVSIDRVEIEP